jgi:predicted nucleic acid-binding protein
VLDTNIVLDWLLFGDPSAAALADAVAAARLRWIASASMRAEAERVLTREALRRWRPDAFAILARWDAAVSTVAEPPPAPLSMRCTDPDDQVFVDLALAHRVAWLFTRDRALLRLARRARAFGVTIRPVRGWTDG